MSEMMEYTRSMANFVCGAAGNRVRRADSSITVSVLLDPAVPVKLVADSTANFTEDFGQSNTNNNIARRRDFKMAPPIAM